MTEKHEYENETKADRVARLLQANYCDGRLSIRPLNKKQWIFNKNDIMREIKSILEYLPSAKMNAIIKGIKVSKNTTRLGTDSNVIQLRNDYYLDDGEVFEGVVDTYTPYYLSIDYDSNAYSTEVDDYFMTIIADGDVEMECAVKEMLGSTIILDDSFKRIYVLEYLGGISADRPVLSNVISNWINNDTDYKMSNEYIHTYSLSLAKMSDTLMLNSLTDSLLNTFAFVDTTKMWSKTYIKSLMTGEPLTYKRSGNREPFEYISNATVIIAGQRMTKVSKFLRGTENRLFPITVSNQPVSFSTDYERSHILNLALEGAKSIKDNGRELFIPKRVQKRINTLIENSK